MAALLGLFWRLLPEGRLKVARGRSWQPEIGMEHASRGRRSGNKGVGARWRGRFRIFSARHCSRTKVSHAENSGMTMLFFSLEVAPVSEGDSFTPSGAATRGVWGFGGLFHMLMRGRHEGVGFPGYVPPQERTARGRLVFRAKLQGNSFTPSPVTACVSDHSRSQAPAPATDLRARNNAQPAKP